MKMVVSGKIIFVIIFTILSLIKANNAEDSVKQDAKCLQPMETGPCRAKLERFYYNAESDTCEKFTFGGCKGNDNKFGFKETCEAACKRSTGKVFKPASSTAEQTNLHQFKSDNNTPKTSTTTTKPDIAGTTVKTIISAPTKDLITVITTKKNKTGSKCAIKNYL